MSDENELLDIAEAAAFLHVSETSLRRWTNAGRLACLRIGQKRERRFRRADLLAFMESQPLRFGSGNGAGPDAARTPDQSNHLCGLFSSDEGRLALALPFLGDGLEEKSVCFLVAAKRARDEILAALGKKHGSTDEHRKKGRLLLSNYYDTPEEQWEYFENAMRKAASSGASTYRVFGDIWEMRKRLSSDLIREYEDGYHHRIARRYVVSTLCAYDARRFNGVEVLHALKLHTDSLRRPLDRMLA